MRVPVKTVVMLLPVRRRPLRSRSSQRLRAGASATASVGCVGAGGTGAGTSTSSAGAASSAAWVSSAWVSSASSMGEGSTAGPALDRGAACRALARACWASGRSSGRAGEGGSGVCASAPKLRRSLPSHPPAPAGGSDGAGEAAAGSVRDSAGEDVGTTGVSVAAGGEGFFLKKLNMERVWAQNGRRRRRGILCTNKRRAWGGGLPFRRCVRSARRQGH